MADIKVDIKDNSEEVLEKLHEIAPRFLTEAGIHLQGEASEALEMAPRRVDTGRLKGSISYEVQGETCYVGTNVEYAGYVHDGTSRMAPNRFLKNAFTANEQQIRDMLEQMLREE